MMKVFRYFAVPAAVAEGLFSNVYAETPAYMKLTAFSAVNNVFYSFFKTIYYILAFALILAAAYYVTKFLAKKGIVQNRTKNMSLLESMPLGQDKRLHLVKVGSQYFLIGSTNRTMEKISEIDPDKLFAEQNEEESFEDDLNDDSIDSSYGVSDFSTQLNTVKKNLNKLKSMVRGSTKDEK